MKPHFVGELDTRLVNELEDKHRLLRRFGFYSALLQNVIWVPKGALTDFASVPRLVGAYLMFGGKGKRAAVIHDWLYVLGKVDPQRWPRELCDDIFKEALQASGYSWLTVQAMYRGVRFGGAAHYEAPALPQSVPTVAEVDGPL